MENKQAAQILSKLSQDNQIRDILQARLAEFYPDFVELLAIKSKIYKKHLGKNSAIFVAGYDCLYRANGDGEKHLNIFVSAHTDNSRYNSFLGNKFLYSHGFASNAFLVPRPLFYLDEFYAFFYQGVRGRIFKRLISQEPNQDFRAVLTLAAGWLRQLHNLDIKNIDLPIKDFFIKEMRPQPARFIEDFVQYTPPVGERLKRVFEDLLTLEKDLSSRVNKTLVHGDFHPENIIVSSLAPERIKVIDFTDLSWADPCLDLGVFLQQFDFMLQDRLERRVINDYKIFFVEAYFGEVFSDIDIEFIKRINLYQAWNTVRNLSFLLYMKDRHHDLLEVVKESENFIMAIRKNQPIINLY